MQKCNQKNATKKGKSWCWLEPTLDPTQVMQLKIKRKSYELQQKQLLPSTRFGDLRFDLVLSMRQTHLKDFIKKVEKGGQGDQVKALREVVQSFFG